MWPFRPDLNFREGLGLALLILSAALTPVAWMTDRMLWVVAGLLAILGAVLFYSTRIVKRLEDDAKEGGEASGSYTGPKMSGDVHNYSGWRSGGRSETMDGGDADD